MRIFAGTSMKLRKLGKSEDETRFILANLRVGSHSVLYRCRFLFLLSALRGNRRLRLL